MPLRILVVDDSATMQKVVRIALSRFDVNVVAAATVIEAMSEISKVPADLIIVDALISGTRSHDDLKNLAGDAKKTPFILLVGTHQNINEADYRAMGFKFFLRKPFESADMVASIAKTLGKDLPTLNGEPAPPPESMGKALPKTPPPPPPPPTGLGAKTPLADESKMPAFKTTVVIPPPPNKRAAEASEGESEEGLPPPPKIDHSRRGQKAFPEPEPFSVNLSGSSVLEDTVRAKLPDPGQQLPPPPAPMSGSKLKSTAPPPPPQSKEAQEQVRMTPPPPPPRNAPPAPAAPGDGSDGVSREELTAMVRKAVEEYCSKHFAGLAREVIAAELRRLAEDRSRHFIE